VGVKVNVLVLGRKNVRVGVGVDVVVGVAVIVGVLVIVPVTISGVLLGVAVLGVPVIVSVMDGVGVTSRGLGANDKQMNPAQ
jgi:hypothetical protein